MSPLLFYCRLGLAIVWFYLTMMVAFCVLPWRWKDPSLGAWVGRRASWGMMRIMGWRVRVENAAALYTSQPCIYVANHQSNLDIVTMGAVFPTRTVAIGKVELKKIPVFGWLFSGVGMILVDRSNRADARECLGQAKDALLKQGHSIWIFPEGTRNQGQGLLPFKKGAFHIAVAAQVPLVPIVEQHLQSYYDKRVHLMVRGEVLIRVLEPISTKGLTAEDVPTLIEQTRARMIAELSKPELKPAAGIPVAAAERS